MRGNTLDQNDLQVLSIDTSALLAPFTDKDVVSDVIEEELGIVSINWLIQLRIKFDHKTEHKLVDNSRINKG